MTPVAHVGHWLVDMLYVLPLLVMGVILLVGKVRQRRETRERQTD
ncbi:MAG: hypothetical protein ACRDPC_23085 [Solirubrobacteraceae bacterium]